VVGKLIAMLKVEDGYISSENWFYQPRNASLTVFSGPMLVEIQLHPAYYKTVIYFVNHQRLSMQILT